MLIPGREQEFFSSGDRLYGSTGLLSVTTRGPVPSTKQLECEDNHSISIFWGGTNVRSYISASPDIFIA
jgi:hypothetical protein